MTIKTRFRIRHYHNGNLLDSYECEEPLIVSHGNTVPQEIVTNYEGHTINQKKVAVYGDVPKYDVGDEVQVLNGLVLPRLVTKKVKKRLFLPQYGGWFYRVNGVWHSEDYFERFVI